MHLQIKMRLNILILIGNEIDNIKEATESGMPEQIGEYVKVYYAYGQVYYADLQSASE